MVSDLDAPLDTGINSVIITSTFKATYDMGAERTISFMLSNCSFHPKPVQHFKNKKRIKKSNQDFFTTTPKAIAREDLPVLTAKFFMISAY